MALTAEQQAQADIQLAIENARHANQMAMEVERQKQMLAAEADRHTKQLELEARRAKLEAIRIAQHTIIENRRNQPVDAREVTAADIAAYAATLVTYINS